MIVVPRLVIVKTSDGIAPVSVLLSSLNISTVVVRKYEKKHEIDAHSFRAQKKRQAYLNASNG